MCRAKNPHHGDPLRGFPSVFLLPWGCVGRLRVSKCLCLSPRGLECRAVLLGVVVGVLWVMAESSPEKSSLGMGGVCLARCFRTCLAAQGLRGAGNISDRCVLHLL